MTHGLGLSAIDEAIHSYPTQGEILRRAAGAWRRTKLKPWMVPVLKWWLKWRR